jgi:hypothetical protein
MSADQLPNGIFKHWVYSHQDKDPGSAVSVFRPSDYNFPPSRGRRGFEIRQNGEFILYEIGPDDRPVKKVGKFKVEGPNKIKVYFEGKTESSFSLGIVGFEDNNNLLRLERLQN